MNTFITFIVYLDMILATALAIGLIIGQFLKLYDNREKNR